MAHKKMNIIILLGLGLANVLYAADKEKNIRDLKHFPHFELVHDLITHPPCKLVFNHEKLTALEGLDEIKVEKEKVHFIELARNKIKSIPKMFGVFKNLTQLNLNSNKLTCIPTVLAKLTKLEILALCKNLISVVNDDPLKELKNLRELNLSENRIVEVDLTWVPGLHTKDFYINLNDNRISRERADELFEAMENIAEIRLFYQMSFEEQSKNIKKAIYQ